MPRELTTWGCDFKCGYTCTKRKAVEDHEPNCFRNPARKACRICKPIPLSLFPTFNLERVK